MWFFVYKLSRDCGTFYYTKCLFFAVAKFKGRENLQERKYFAFHPHLEILNFHIFLFFNFPVRWHTDGIIKKKKRTFVFTARPWKLQFRVALPRANCHLARLCTSVKNDEGIGFADLDKFQKLCVIIKLTSCLSFVKKCELFNIGMKNFFNSFFYGKKI